MIHFLILSPYVFCIVSHKVTLHIDATQDETDLNDVNSPTYKNNVHALESSVREEYKTEKGEQIVANPKFWFVFTLVFLLILLSFISLFMVHIHVTRQCGNFVLSF